MNACFSYSLSMEEQKIKDREILYELRKMISSNDTTGSDGDTAGEVGVENMKNKNNNNHILPPMSSADVKMNKKTVIFDLDRTLIYSIKLYEGGPPERFDFFVDTNNENVAHRHFLSKRPGVGELVQGVAILGAYEIVVFSAARKEYVNAVVEKLLQDLPPIEGIHNNMDIIPPTHRLARDMCTQYRYPGETKIRRFKDLSLLGRDLSKVIIVDDSLLAFHKHPFNGINIDPWTGDANDNCLFTVLLSLQEIANSDADVTTLLSSHGGLDSSFLDRLSTSPPHSFD